jgi:hypothetical protein
MYNIYDDSDVEATLELVMAGSSEGKTMEEETEMLEFTEKERRLIETKEVYSAEQLARLVRRGEVRLAVAVGKHIGRKSKKFATLVKKFFEKNKKGEDAAIASAYALIRTHVNAGGLEEMQIKDAYVSREEWADAWAAYKDAEDECRAAANAAKKELTIRANDVRMERTKAFGDWDAYFERANEKLREEGRRIDALDGWRKTMMEGGDKRRAERRFHKEWAARRQEALKAMEEKNGGLGSLKAAPVPPSDLPERYELVDSDDVALRRDSNLFRLLPAYTSALAARGEIEGWTVNDGAPATPDRKREADVSLGGTTPSRKRLRTSFSSVKDAMEEEEGNK